MTEYLARQRSGLSQDEFHTSPRTQLPKITQPIVKVLRKTIAVTGAPPGDGFIAGICRGAIQQCEQGNRFSLSLKLSRHFIGDISPKAVPAQVVGARRLKHADF